MADVFNNPSNDYIVPGLAPCPGVGDQQYLQWTTDGMTIIRGSTEISHLSFGDMRIPVNSFNKQQKILEPGEVTFIQGLSKGLCIRQQGFKLPELVSQDENKNLYYLQVDLTVSFYKNFKRVEENLTATGNYEHGIRIDNALDILFKEENIEIVSDYDEGESILGFAGKKHGYEFKISDVTLTILDTSTAGYEDSPFLHGDNDEEYLLEEDPEYDIPFIKYSNTAMQGIIFRGYYPSGTQTKDVKPRSEDKWIYLHHIKDYVTLYSKVDDPSCMIDEPAYLKEVKKVEVGTNNSVDDVISVSDYLNWVTENNKWKKVGESYIWTTSKDFEDCTNKNLLEGFYVFNPQLYPVKIEYIVFI